MMMEMKYEKYTLKKRQINNSNQIEYVMQTTQYTFKKKMKQKK